MTMSRVLVAVLVASVAGAQEPVPYRLSPSLDVPLVAGGLTLFVGGVVALKSLDGPSCFPCDRDGLNGLDRAALGYESRAARLTSDVLLYTISGGAVIGDLVDVTLTRGGLVKSEAAADLLVLAEVHLINDGITALVKASVARPRPAAFQPESYPGAGSSAGNSQSFYSGHASQAFAFATAAAVTVWRRHPRGPARWIVLGTGLALASTTAAMRVFGGRHHPTDVMVGAAAGAAVGLAVPLLHDRGVWIGPGSLSARF